MMNCEDTGGIQLKVVNLKIKKDGSRELLVGNTPNEVRADSSYLRELYYGVYIVYRVYRQL